MITIPATNEIHRRPRRAAGRMGEAAALAGEAGVGFLSSFTIGGNFAKLRNSLVVMMYLKMGVSAAASSRGYHVNSS